jgi:hypothetical protein
MAVTMTQDACYRIAPNQAGRAVLSRYDEDTARFFGEPVLWRKTESDRSAWSRPDHVIQVKLLFLVWLKSEYGGEAAVSELLPSSQLDVPVFDRFWELERFDFPDDVEQVEDEVTSAAANLLAPQDRPLLAGWAAALQSKATRKGSTR